tara:strand:- start:486 stop:1820 length:1335 start_codon:yes stop_codon:yes gene_type:complete
MKRKQKKRYSRRTFIEQASKLAAASVILSHLPARQKKTNSIEGEIKVAVVGCGGRGTGAAAQAIEADKDVRIVALSDVFLDQAQDCLSSLKEKYSESDQLGISRERIFTGFGSYKSAIDLADVVILTTPPAFRPQHFEYAVKKNKHVFMEKPVATDVAGIKKIIKSSKIAREKKLNVVVGLQRHYQKNYQTLYKKIKQGKVGHIVSGQVYWNSGGVWVRPRKKNQTELEYQMRNWYYFNWLCGDHIVEQHIHNIDVANWFIGSVPVSAQGMGGREVRKGKDHGQIFDHHFVEFTYPNGEVVSSQCRHQKGCMNRVEETFQTTRGNFTLNGGGEGIIKNNRGRTLYEHNSTNDLNPYQQEHNDLFGAIKVGKYLYDDTKRGVEATMTAILGRMATYTGQVVSWDDALSLNHSLVPDLRSLKDNAPVNPNSRGEYPVPIPGITTYR